MGKGDEMKRGTGELSVVMKVFCLDCVVIT